jgi:O-antigen ligase
MLFFHATPNRAVSAITVAGAAACFALWLASAQFHAAPFFFLIIAAPAAVLAVVAVRKWPVVLLTALLFVGNFKSVPADHISLTDPTIILLVLTASAVLVELWSLIIANQPWTIRNLVGGQELPILIFVLFIAVFAASILYSPDRGYGLQKLSRFATFEVIAFFAPLLLIKDARHLRQFVLTAIALSIALVAKDVLDLIYASTRVVEGNADVTHIGDGMLFAVAILLTVYHGIARSALLNYAVIGVLAIGMIASAARSPFVALVITIVVCAVCTKAVPRKKLLGGIVIIVLIGFLTLRCLEELPWVRSKVTWKETELLSVASGYLIEGGTINDRLSYDRSALEALKEHPLVGLGIGGWASFYSPDEIPRFPHDFLLEVAAEQGFVGFVLLVTLLIILFRKSLSLGRCQNLAFLFPVLTFLVFYNAMTGDIENRQLWCCFGMVVVGSRMARLSAERKIHQLRPMELGTLSFCQGT